MHIHFVILMHCCWLSSARLCHFFFKAAAALQSLSLLARAERKLRRISIDYSALLKLLFLACKSAFTPAQLLNFTNYRQNVYCNTSISFGFFLHSLSVSCQKSLSLGISTGLFLSGHLPLDNLPI